MMIPLKYSGSTSGESTIAASKSDGEDITAAAKKIVMMTYYEKWKTRKILA